MDDRAIRWVLRHYRPRMIQEWADITLAAEERHGVGFFRKSAAAYFIDNLKHAAADRRTPPDWWRDLRREEARRQRDGDRERLEHVAAGNEETAFQAYLDGEAREEYQQVVERLAGDLMSKGKSDEEAKEFGSYQGRLHFLNRFRRTHPEFYADGFVKAGSMLMASNE